jgi:pimeloyl-ACP methyl ester carboxylesterase
VLLLHGGGQTRHAWEETARSLAAMGWHVVSLDLRGHGDSEHVPDGDYRLEAFAGDIAEVARSFPAKPVIVGASLGGISALLAQDDGDVARAVVLVDVAPRMEPAGVGKIVGFMRAYPEGFASLEEAGDAVAAYLTDRPRPRDLAGLAKNLRVDASGRHRWHWDARFLGGPLSVDASRKAGRLADAARALRVPALLVRGKRSDLLSAEGAREFLELVPHAEFVDVRDAGHMIVGDQNDAFTRAVAGFLEKLR